MATDRSIEPIGLADLDIVEISLGWPLTTSPMQERVSNTYRGDTHELPGMASTTMGVRPRQVSIVPDWLRPTQYTVGSTE